MPNRLYWLGPRHAAAPRLLGAAGLQLQPAATVGALSPDADVVFVSGDDHGIYREILEHAPDAKVISVVTRPADVLDALAIGAHDAVSVETPADELLARAVVWQRVAANERRVRAAHSALVERARGLEARLEQARRANGALLELAHRDDLTRLGNRRSFFATLSYASEYAARYGGAISIVLLDLDGLKQLNDAHGHEYGDRALRAVADVLRASVRTVDHAARLGGDEFGVVMPATGAADAARVAERMRRRLSGLRLPEGIRITASLGVAAVAGAEARSVEADGLVRRADRALYAAKRAGKDTVHVHLGAHERAA